MRSPRLRRSAALGLACLCAAGLSVSRAVPSPERDAAGDADAARPGVVVRGVVIPTGFRRDGTYSALVQIVVDGSPLAGATWDLEASRVPVARAQPDISGRIVVGEPGMAAVLEGEMVFRPGPFGLKLGAHEKTAGQTASGQIGGRWPNPDAARAAVSPVAILQPAQAAFVRDGNSRGQGALGRGAEEPVRAELTIALVSLVCRGPTAGGPLRVERQLRGTTSIDFDAIRLEVGDERCVQVRDLIRPGTVTEGFFKYVVRVFSQGEELTSAAREFSAVGP